MISIMFQRPDRGDGIKKLSECMSPHTVLLIRRPEITFDDRQHVDYVCAFDRPDVMMETLCDYRFAKPLNAVMARLSCGYPFERSIYVEVSTNDDVHFSQEQAIRWLLVNGESVAEKAIDRVAREYLNER